MLSLLRTVGLTAWQARAMLLVEVAPMMVTAVLTGAAVGLAVPLLLAPALGLSALTAGVPLRPQIDPVTAVLLAGLFAVLLSGAVLTEAAANRRLGLGRVLRLGRTDRSPGAGPRARPPRAAVRSPVTPPGAAAGSGPAAGPVPRTRDNDGGRRAYGWR